ncbi:MAG TPA: FAD-dependent oxidoreductase [Longimicrobiaceae bacterium]|nr:FAD-dependent oxidoreductase [Longimicrobiaceae bacterium]
MSSPGTADQPLRVAVVGSGPAGFFVAQHLLAKSDLAVTVDLYERLLTPFGLVRFGVAPDHEEIKRVSRQFEKVAAKPAFRFFGTVDVGSHLTLDELRRYYHLICFTTGAQTDRRMGIPGEELARSHAATEFVAWYNGHPEYRDRHFDLSVERVAVVGVGNVAVDVARILSRTADELSTTDIADHALRALQRSRIKEVYILGRRGPVQAAFTNAEVKELGELAGADIRVPEDEIALDPLSHAEVERSDERSLHRKLEILRDFASRSPAGKGRTLTIRFLVSPVELVGNGAGEVVGLRVVRNRLVADGRGGLRAEATDRSELLPVGLVFRSVGYHGVPLAGLPFDEKRGVVPNDRGRVLAPPSDVPLPGVYVGGWIKRGPSGVIGTNKPDAAQTVEAMLEDLALGVVPSPPHPQPAAIEAFLRQRQPALVTYADWRRIDQLETARGQALGRPRVKFTSQEEMLAALNREEEDRQTMMPVMAPSLA